MERSEACNTRMSDEVNYTKLGAQKESKQEGEKEAGADDLLPEVDGTDLSWSWPRPARRLLSAGNRARSGKEKPKEPAKGVGITMIVRVGNQEQEPDGQKDGHRRRTRPRDASVSSSACSHPSSPGRGGMQ